MTRYERKLFFERLLAMRDVYRGEAHAATDLTLEGMPAFAKRAWHAAAAVEAATTTTTARKGASTTG